MVREVPGDPTVGIEVGVEDGHLKAGSAAGSEGDIEDLLELRPQEAIGLPVVDGRHHGVVEHVDVEVDPEPLGAAVGGEVLRHRLGGLPGTARPDGRQIERLDRRGKRPTALGRRQLGVSESNDDHVLVADERAQGLVAGKELGASTGDKSELHRRGFAGRFGLRLVEVGVAVEEEQAIAAALPQGGHGAQQDAAVSAEDERELVTSQRVVDRCSEITRICRDRLRVEDAGAWVDAPIPARRGDRRPEARPERVRQSALKQSRGSPCDPVDSQP